MQFGVNVQIFGFGIFQEGPELLQSIELACETMGRWAMKTTERWGLKQEGGPGRPLQLGQTLTSLIVLHGLLLEILEYVQPELLL